MDIFDIKYHRNTNIRDIPNNSTIKDVLEMYKKRCKESGIDLDPNLTPFMVGERGRLMDGGELINIEPGITPRKYVIWKNNRRETSEEFSSMTIYDVRYRGRTHLQDIPINSTVKDVLEMYKERCKESGINLDFDTIPFLLGNQGKPLGEDLLLSGIVESTTQMNVVWKNRKNQPIHLMEPQYKPYCNTNNFSI